MDDALQSDLRHQRLDAVALDQLFRTARTRKSWSPRAVSTATLEELYALASFGPTSMNCSPARFLFITSPAAKARLAPFLHESNVGATLAAPVCAIIGYDLHFADRLPQLFPHFPGAAEHFADPVLARETAFRNGTLQGAYLILAARALGLDAGPMSGFDALGVTAAFFPGGQVEANFLCNLGYATDEFLFPRQPRLAFDDAATVL